MARPGCDLLRRMARGDRDAFAAFYDAYAPLAFGILRRMLPPDEAAEALQDVFWEIWRAAGDYDDRRGTPEAWVVVRARSRGVDRLRSVRRREEMMVDGPMERAGAMEAEPARHPGAVVEERDTVRGALEALPASQRQVIELAYLAGLTHTEIALRLGEPLGTVKTRIRLGMERLRGLIGARQ